MKEKAKFLNTYINNVTFDEAVLTIEDFILKSRRSYVVTINTDFIVKIENDNYFKEIIDNADLAVIDGKPLLWISKIILNLKIQDKISGSDLVPRLIDLANIKGYSIFLIGGKEGVAEKAKKNILKDYPNVRIVGIYSPKIGFEKNEVELNKINSMINKTKPDIVIACVGCPKQEKWIYENYQQYDAKVSIGAGATIDFLAGTIPRAPAWISNIGFEWLYRFFKEPKRLFKRYFVDDMKIFRIIKKYGKQ